MPLINESLKYSKENPSRAYKPKILGFQNNGGCLFPSYHAQKQNLAESETKDFGLVPTIASTEGSKANHWVISSTAPKHPDPARCCSKENRAHPPPPTALCPGEISPCGGSFKRPKCRVGFFYPYFFTAEFCFLRIFSTYNRAATLTPFSLSNSC